jgi:hypothetical protein
MEEIVVIGTPFANIREAAEWRNRCVPFLCVPARIPAEANARRTIA